MSLSKIKKEVWKYHGDIKPQFKKILGDYVREVSEKSFDIPSTPGTNISIEEKTGVRMPHLDEAIPMGGIYRTIEGSTLRLSYPENTSEENLNEIRGLVKKIKC